MKIGSHVSIAGGIPNAPLRAFEEGCETFQIFSRSPRGGKAPVLTPELIVQFQAECKKYRFRNFYIHTPYYINFASKNNRIKHGSVSVVREELERGTRLGMRAVVTHLGSSKEYNNPQEALKETARGISKVLEGYTGSCRLALEISAGSGGAMGYRFEDLAFLLKNARPKNPEILGVCLDTAHTLAAGYDIRNTKGVDETVRAFDTTIGLASLFFLHFNDSKADLAEHVDRHEHLEKGKISKEGLVSLMNHPKLQKLDFILETEPDDRKKDLAWVKKFRKKN